MALRLQAHGKSIYGEDFWVKIIDTDYTGDVLDMSVGPDVLIETNGNDRDITETIYTASATIDVFINTEAAEDFFDDLIAAPEGRFYLQIDFNNNDEIYFRGRILGNGVSIEDRLQPFVKVQAIDGLTLLKDIPFDETDYEGDRMVSFMLSVLNKIDVVDKFFLDTDPVFEAVTCLQANHAYFVSDPYIFKLLRYNDYFYKIDGKKIESWSCWDVLEELLKRHMLCLSYYKGMYFLTGKDIFLSASTKQYLDVTKEGTITTYTWSGISTVDIQSTVGGNQPYALAGGTFYFEPGIKRLTILADKEYTAANLTYGRIWRRADTTYSLMGLMLAGEPYQTYLKVTVPYQYPIEVTSPPNQDPKLEYFKIRFYFKADEWQGSDIYYPKFDGTANNPVNSHIFMQNAWTDPARTLINSATETAIDVLFRFQNNNLEFSLNFIFPTYAADTTMNFRSEFVGWYDQNIELITTLAPAINGFDYEITQEFGKYPNLIPDVVKFAAETDTEDVEKKELQFKGVSTYANLFTKGYIWNNSPASPSVFVDEWRFDSGDSYEGLEYAIVRNYLKLIGPKQKFIDIALNMTVIVPAIYYRLLYRDEYYICSKVSWNVHQATAQITGIRIPSTEPNITVNLQAPTNTPFFVSLDNPETPIYARDTGNIGTIVYQEFTGVTTSSVNLDDAPFLSDYLINFVQALTEEQIRARFEVWKDGVKQRYVPFDIPLTLDTRDFSLDWANNDVLINNDLGDSYTIEVKFLET